MAKTKWSTITVLTNNSFKNSQQTILYEVLFQKRFGKLRIIGIIYYFNLIIILLYYANISLSQYEISC